MATYCKGTSDTNTTITTQEKAAQDVGQAIYQRDDKGAYTNLHSEFYRTDTQAFTNYTRMMPESFN